MCGTENCKIDKIMMRCRCSEQLMHKDTVTNAGPLCSTVWLHLGGLCEGANAIIP
jgi:hypothetical protein